MPDATLEFQIRLTRDEYNAYMIQRRGAAAEKRFRRLAEQARRSREAQHKHAEEIPKDVIAMSGPYVEPAKLESYLYRSVAPQKWVAGDFSLKDSK
jgi:hypothetical protein